MHSSEGADALLGDADSGATDLVNDVGFRIVREYFRLKLKKKVAAWSVLQTIASVVGLALTALLSSPPSARRTSTPSLRGTRRRA